MFRDRTVIITGGSSGVGKALAGRLATAGAHLAIVARDPEKIDGVIKELRGMVPAEQRIAGFSCDVVDPGAVETLMRQISETVGLPHILINSAGILREGYFENQGIEIFREVMDINFFGTLHCIRAVLPYFRDAGSGRVVNIASVAGLIGVFGYTAYCASKHAVVGLTASLRAEFSPRNIRFHVVCPPEFDSPMVDAINLCRTPENTAMAHTIPVMTADAVADAILRGIEKGRYEIIPGFFAKAATRADKWFPALSRAVVDFEIRQCQRREGKNKT